MPSYEDTLQELVDTFYKAMGQQALTEEQEQRVLVLLQPGIVVDEELNGEPAMRLHGLPVVRTR